MKAKKSILPRFTIGIDIGKHGAICIQEKDKEISNIKMPMIKTELDYQSLYDVLTPYEGGNGFTNSLSNKIIEQYVNIDLINSSIKKSKSINDLIIESSERGRVKWLHIDVEGLDGELIYAIKDDLLPELLLFESLHMENEYYDNLCNYLINKGYSITKSGWNTICLK